VTTPGRDAVVVDVVRTAAARGEPRAALATVHPVDLLATALLALTDRTGIAAKDIDEIIAGCVVQIDEQSSNIARTASLAAGFPESVPGLTIDRHAASSQHAIHLAVQGIVSGAYDTVIACGVESMSRIRKLTGSHDTDAINVRLQHRYPAGLVNPGVAAELICARWDIGRTELDEFAARSHARAAQTWSDGHFDHEVVPVDVSNPYQAVMEHRVDETIRPSATPARLAEMKAVFYSDLDASRFPEIQWRITRGNSSQRADGSAAALIMSAERAAACGLTPRARLRATAVTGSDAMLMMSGVAEATREVLRRAHLNISDIDAFEIDETFAAIPLVWNREFQIAEDQLNPRGGAIALGNPLGATGARMFATLLNYLEHVDGQFGLQATTAAGGMTNVFVVERL
jgi:acetyl-CoA acyltransferase